MDIEVRPARIGPEERPGGYDLGVPLPGTMPKTPHWSVPWSDLMMTMFIFFAILYFFQTNGNESLSGEKEGFASRSSVSLKTSRSGPSPGQDDARSFSGTAPQSMASLYRFSKETVEAKDLKDFASVGLVRDQAVRIVLAGDLLFDTGTAEIKGRAKASLRELAPIIRAVPYMVNVVGHTDDVPIQSQQFPSNWELSVMRASRVARFLIDEMNLPGERFYVTGHAYHQPVKPNNSDANRTANRRVEIIITKERPQGTGERGDAIGASFGLPFGAVTSEYARWPWNTFF